MNDGREPLLVNDGTRPRSKLSIFFYYKRNPLCTARCRVRSAAFGG